jgi:glucokinase
MGARAAIGIDVGGTGTKGGIVDAAGTILARVDRPTDPGAGTKGILGAVEELLIRATDINAEVAAVGVGAAAFIDARRGAVTFSPNIVYDDPHIADALRARFHLPVILDNDANAAAWGERSFGTARGLDHVVMLTLGTGIGSGIIVEGRLLRGSTGAAAELGHTIIDPSGPECPCGLRGCFEQLASGTAIARMAREWTATTDPDSSILSFAGTSEQITAEHVAKAAREYDETARSILREAGRALGRGLSNVANIFDPDVIVLGGSVVSAGESYLGPARDELARMSLAQRRRPMRLDVAALGNDAGIVGAAALAFHEVS